MASSSVSDNATVIAALSAGAKISEDKEDPDLLHAIGAARQCFGDNNFNLSPDEFAAVFDRYCDPHSGEFPMPLEYVLAKSAPFKKSKKYFVQKTPEHAPSWVQDLENFAYTLWEKDKPETRTAFQNYIIFKGVSKGSSNRRNLTFNEGMIKKLRKMTMSKSQIKGLRRRIAREGREKQREQSLRMKKTKMVAQTRSKEGNSNGQPATSAAATSSLASESDSETEEQAEPPDEGPNPESQSPRSPEIQLPVIALTNSGFQQPSSRKRLCETSANSEVKRVKVEEELDVEAGRDTIEIPAGSDIEQSHAINSWAWTFLTDEQRRLYQDQKREQFQLAQAEKKRAARKHQRAEMQLQEASVTCHRLEEHLLGFSTLHVKQESSELDESEEYRAEKEKADAELETVVGTLIESNDDARLHHDWHRLMGMYSTRRFGDLYAFEDEEGENFHRYNADNFKTYRAAVAENYRFKFNGDDYRVVQL